MNVLRSLCRTGGLAKKFCQTPALKTSLPAIQTRFLSDSLLVNALDNEISHESEGKEVPDLSSFLTEYRKKINGTNVELQKNFGNETIKIKFDLNNQQELPPSDDDTEGNPPQYLPNFSIEIAKPQGTLMFNCYYPNPEEELPENIMDQYVIDEVKYVKPGGDVDTSYNTDFGNLDTVLIEEFDQYLDRRGLDQEFSSELLLAANAFEQKYYINFLKDVRDFL